MEIIRVTCLLLLLALTACQGKSLSDTVAQSNLPAEWAFHFFTPKALPALSGAPRNSLIALACASAAL